MAQLREEPRYSYQVVAATVAARVEAGYLASGTPAPTATELASEHGVSVATAKRSLALLQEWGVLLRLNQNLLILETPTIPLKKSAVHRMLPLATLATEAGDEDCLLTFVLRRRGEVVARFSSVADPTNPIELHEILVAAIDRAGGGDPIEYELDVVRPDENELFLRSWPRLLS